MKAPLVLAAALAIPLVTSSAVGQTKAPPPPPPAPPSHAAPAAPPGPAFPPPKLVQVTGDLKCAWGTVKSKISNAIIVETPAGPFTVQTGDARVVNAEGKPAAAEPGQNVRIYFVVKDGARAREIDVIPPGK